MRLFKKKSGLNPLDAPSKRNIHTMAKKKDGRQPPSPNKPNSPVLTRNNPSFKITEHDVKRITVLGSEHCMNNHNHNNIQKEQSPSSPTKRKKPKKQWWKRFKVHRKKTKLKGNDGSSTLKHPRSESSITVVSPPSSSVRAGRRVPPDEQYFSMPTQGFECILDENDLQHVNVDIQSNHNCQGVIAEQLPVVLAAQAGCDTSPLYNWESFVALLTATNQTLITTIYDANDTLQSFLEEDSVDEGQRIQDHTRASDVKQPVERGNLKKDATTLLADKPVKEVTFKLSNTSLPFDESDGMMGGKDIINEADKSSSTSTMEALSTTAPLPNNMNGEGGIDFQRRIERQGQGKQIIQQIQQRQQQEKQLKQHTQQTKKDDVPLKKSISQLKTKTKVANAPLVMPYEVPNLKAPLEEVFDSSFTLSFLRVSKHMY